MFEKLFRKFEKEPLETGFSESAEIFRKKKKSEISGAKNRGKKIRSEIEESLEQLDDVLAEMEDFDDYSDRKVIEDVMDNIGSDRRRIIDDLELPDDPDELHEELEEFIKDFQDMSRKEQAVIDEAVLPDGFRDAIEDLSAQRDRLEEFLEGPHETLRKARRLDDIVEQRRELINEIEELEAELSENRLEELEEERDEIEKKLEELKDSEKWINYQRLLDELEKSRERKRKKKKEIATTMSKTERGLKKLLYRAENGDIDLGVDKGLLKDIRDGNVGKVLKTDSEKVESIAGSVREALPDDLLGERQEEKFLEGISGLEDFSDYADSMASFEDEINSLEKQTENHDALEKRNELEKDLERIESEIGGVKDEEEDLQEKIRVKEEELEGLEDQVRKIMDEAFKRDVTITVE